MTKVDIQEVCMREQWTAFLFFKSFREGSNPASDGVKKAWVRVGLSLKYIFTNPSASSQFSSRVQTLLLKYGTTFGE